MMISITDNDLNNAAMELEKLRKLEQKSSQKKMSHRHVRFPLNCLKVLYNIPGNLRCLDCGATNPQWATLPYGALLCIDCSGRHRQMGVQVSVVRSISMDSWKYSDVLAMLEGGNSQLGDFFTRHRLSSSYEMKNEDNNTCTSNIDMNFNRYKTNAAKFYKTNLSLHVSKVREGGVYKGRSVYRQSSSSQKKKCNVQVVPVVTNKDKTSYESLSSSEPDRRKMTDAIGTH